MAVTVAQLQAHVGADTSDGESKLASFGKTVAGFGIAAGGTAALASKALEGVGRALTGAISGSIGAAADFQAILSQVGAVSGATEKELAGLSSLALKMGKDTSFSASQAAAAMAELAKGGIEVQDMAAVLPGTLDLAAAGGLGLAEAATIATDSMAIFGKQGVTMDQVANAFAGAANISSISVQDMAQSMKYVGPVAAALGITLEDTSAALALLGANGVKGSEAGTGLRTMLLGLSAPTKKSAALMKDLGLEFFDSSGKIKDMAGIADQLKSHLAGMSDQQRIATLETLFGKEGMSAAIAVMGDGENSIQSYTDRLKTAASAHDTGVKMLDNFKGSMEQLKGSVETAGITIGLALLPVLRKAVDGLTGAVNAALPFIEAWGPKLAAGLQAGIGGLLSFAGAVFNGARSLIDAFNAFRTGQTTLAEFVGGLEIFAGAVLGKLGGLATQAAPYIGQFFGAIGNAIVEYGPQILAQMGVWAGYLVNWVTDTAIPWLLPKLAAFGESLWGWITGVAVPAVVSAVGGLASAFGGWISGTAIPYLTENLPLWKDAIVGWVRDTAVPEVKAAVGGMVSALGDWIRGDAIPYLADNMPFWIDALKSWITDSAVPSVVGVAVGLKNAIVDWLTDAATYLGEKFPQWRDALVNWIKDDAVPAVTGAVVGVKNALVNWITETAIPLMRERMGTFTTSIGSFLLETTAPAVKAASDANLPAALNSGIVVATGESGTHMETWYEAIERFIEGIGPRLDKALQPGSAALGDWIGHSIVNVGVHLAKWIGTIIAVVTSLPVTLPILLAVGTAKLYSWIADAIGPTALAIFQWLVTVQNAVAQLIVSLSVGLFGAAKALYNNALTIGKNIVQGIIDGILGGRGRVLSAAASLGDSATSGAQGALEEKSPSKVFFRIGQFAVQGLIDGMDSAKQDAAKKAAEVASAISKAIIDTLAAMKALATYDFATQSPSGETMGWFTHLTTSLVQNLATAAAEFDEQSLKATSAFADTVGKVGGAVGSAVNGLKALATADWAKTSPSGSAMAWLTHLVASLIENFRNAATAFDEEGMKQASAFADTASKVLGIIGNGVTALQALNSFVAPSKQAIDNFLAAALYVVNRFGEVAETLSTEGIAKTTAFANSAALALNATKSGVDAFVAFKSLVVPSAQAIDALMNGMQYVILRMQDMATAIGVDGLKRAEDFATSAGRVFGTVKAGLDLLNSLKTYKDLPSKAIDNLIEGMKLAFERMGELQSQANAFEQQADTFLGTMERANLKLAKGMAIGAGISVPNTGSTGRSMTNPFPHGDPLTTLPALAAGGVVRRPTIAIVGEAGPEAVIPLPASGGLGGNVYNFYGDLYGDADMEDRIVAAIENASRRGRS